MINKLLAAVAVTAAATLAHVGDAHAQAGLLGHRTDLEPITLASGMNWMPCWRSSASASTFAVLMSYSATVRAKPRMSPA